MNKQDFLNSIIGKPTQINVEGMYLSIKSVSIEDLELIESTSSNNADRALLLIVYGLVDPKLEKEDIDQLKKAKPGLIMKLAEMITKISGLTDEDESPTGGSVSVK